MHLKYIKLVILKILFVLGLRNFKFSFKIPWHSPTKIKISDPPPSEYFSKIFNHQPPPPSPLLLNPQAGVGVHAMKIRGV